MTTRRGARRRFSRGARRVTEWLDTTISHNTIATGATVINDLLIQLPADEKKGANIARAIIEITAQMSVASSGGIASLGITTMQGDALAALAYPDPQEDSDRVGWLWRAQKIVASDSVNDSSQFARFVFDIRTSRSLRGADMNMLLILHYAGADSVNFDGFIRLLVKKV